MSENKKPIYTVGVAIIKNDKILLVKHGQAASHLNDTYGLPAGRLNEGENEKEAALRELEEETGLRCGLIDLYEYPNNKYEAEIERKNGEKKYFIIKIFICSKFDGKLKSSNETMPEWKDVNEINKLNLLPNIARISTDVLNFLNQKK